ncbi:hypothetical protein [Falsiroseomonas oryzae]|uniref:hypothetical protein n=1 Tax=Falsiroseomonas oryzae TaxID=2766473 RepID=UPI0022EB893B|nr:hypothetical protein [Roseomonas sp. MO-31]
MESAVGRDRRVSMMPSRIGAAVLAASLAVPPALAREQTTYHYLETERDALQPCRAGVLLNMPATWQSGDGGVVLLTMERRHDAAHDALVSALLFEEHAAVLELAPTRCEEGSDEQDGVVAGALDALDVMTRRMGSGMAVAIGYGPGSRAILGVVHASAARLRDTGGPGFAAAVAIGDGAPAFALGAPLPAQEGAPLRLAALCRALAAVVGGISAGLESAAHASAAEACTTAMGADALPVAAPVRATAHR